MARVFARSSAFLVSDWSRVTTRAMAPTTSVTPTNTEARTVVRARTEPQRQFTSTTVRVQAIADQSDCLQACPTGGLVDALAKLTDVDLDDVRVTVEGKIPYAVSYTHLTLPTILR